MYSWEAAICIDILETNWMSWNTTWSFPVWPIRLPWLAPMRSNVIWWCTQASGDMANYFTFPKSISTFEARKRISFNVSNFQKFNKMLWFFSRFFYLNFIFWDKNEKIFILILCFETRKRNRKWFLKVEQKNEAYSEENFRKREFLSSCALGDNEWLSKGQG